MIVAPGRAGDRERAGRAGAAPALRHPRLRARQGRSWMPRSREARRPTARQDSPGDQATEFSAAGGVALAHLELGEVEEAERWLDTAAEVASAARPRADAAARAVARHGPRRRRRRGRDARPPRAGARAGDRSGPAPPPAARRSRGWRVEAARLGRATGDDGAARARRASPPSRRRRSRRSLPGHAPWGPSATRPSPTVALGARRRRGGRGGRVAAMQALQDGQHEDVYPDVLLPRARDRLRRRAARGAGPVRGYLQIALVADRPGRPSMKTSASVGCKGPLGSRARGAAPASSTDGAPAAGGRRPRPPRRPRRGRSRDRCSC